MEETSTQRIYWNEENEIVYGDLHGELHTVADAVENIDAQERLKDKLGKEQTRVLVDMRYVKYIAKEPRDYFANERTASIQRATALVISSGISRVIGNFFLGFNKPISPTRLLRTLSQQ